MACGIWCVRPTADSTIVNHHAKYDLLCRKVEFNASVPGKNISMLFLDLLLTSKPSHFNLKENLER